MDEKPRRPAWVNLLVIYVGVTLLYFVWKYSMSLGNLPPSHPAMNYRATVICPDAMDLDEDHSKEVIRHFEVKLREGCFGGLIHIPLAWHQWYWLPVGDQDNYWIALWPEGQRSYGPYLANADTHLEYKIARLQGHGTVRFYSNDVVAKRNAEKPITEHPPENNVSAPDPEPTTLSIYQNQDPRICDKTADVYYRDSQHLENPTFLFDSQNEGLSFGYENRINWAHGFTGKIHVCFIIDEKGFPGHIMYVQTPTNPLLTERITKYISGLRYEPGRHEERAVPVMWAFEFIFH